MAALTPSSAVAAGVIMTPVIYDSPPFWDLEKEFEGYLNNQIDCYNRERLESKLRPVTFKLVGAIMITNARLDAQFIGARERLTALGRGVKQLYSQRAFHGTHPRNIEAIATNGLLRIGHPLNPSKSTDPGYFGTPTKGIYVSRKLDYCLKYSNRGEPLQPSTETKVIMFDCIPGLSCHIPELKLGMDPTSGYDSHSSANWQEWYLFNEDQCVPRMVLTVRAIENRRTAEDDEKHDAATVPAPDVITAAATPPAILTPMIPMIPIIPSLVVPHVVVSSIAAVPSTPVATVSPNAASQQQQPIMTSPVTSVEIYPPAPATLVAATATAAPMMLPPPSASLDVVASSSLSSPRALPSAPPAIPPRTSIAVTATRASAAAPPSPQSIVGSSSVGMYTFGIKGASHITPSLNIVPLLSSSSWSTPRAHCQAVRINDNVYIAGGQSSGSYKPCKTMDIYNIPSGRWSKGSDLLIPRSGHIMVQLTGTYNENRIMCIGGVNDDVDEKSRPSCEIIDTSAKSLFGPKWTMAPMMHSKRSGGCGVNYRGKVYVFGGYGAYSACEVYEETAGAAGATPVGRWTSLGDGSALDAMNSPVAAVVIGDIILVLGTNWDAVAEYTPATNSWVKCDWKIPELISCFGAIYDEKTDTLIIAGGSYRGSEGIGYVYERHHPLRSWSSWRRGDAGAGSSFGYCMAAAVTPAAAAAVVSPPVAVSSPAVRTETKTIASPTAAAGTGTGTIGMHVFGQTGAFYLTPSRVISLPTWPVPQVDCCAVRVADTIWVVGGNGSAKKMSKDFYIQGERNEKETDCFNVATQKWTRGSDLNRDRYAHTCVQMIGSTSQYRIMAIGGHYEETCEILDATPKKWSLLKPSWSKGASLATSRRYSCSAALGGRIYVFGGTEHDRGLRTCEVYHEDSKASGKNKWSFIANLPVERTQACAVAIGNVILVLGGKSDSARLDSIEQYDPFSNTWRTLSWTLPAARNCFGAVYDPSCDTLMIAGGYESINGDNRQSGEVTGTIYTRRQPLLTTSEWVRATAVWQGDSFGYCL